MKMRWQLPSKNPRRGTQKKKETKENTNTTPLARNGRTLKRQGNRKADGRRAKKPTSGGGGRRNTTYKARTKAYLSTQGPKPDVTREHATHEIGDAWGTS